LPKIAWAKIDRRNCLGDIGRSCNFDIEVPANNQWIGRNGDGLNGRRAPNNIGRK
jgi:hypothetical protein